MALESVVIDQHFVEVDVRESADARAAVEGGIGGWSRDPGGVRLEGVVWSVVDRAVFGDVQDVRALASSVAVDFNPENLLTRGCND
ncbi:MAG: hypothetical protein ACI855_002927 [Myxococcota bacterium]